MRSRPVGIRSRYRAATDALHRTAWMMGVPYRAPIGPLPLPVPIVAVLGMHRSGTSAAVGILEDQGFTVPAIAPEGLADNKRGTRESRWLVGLSNDVLRLNEADWSDPPESELRYRRSHVVRRNRLVEWCIDRQCVLKDPRMLLMLDLWADVNLKPIGVVRNPIDVAESLMRRDDELTQRQCLDLWKVYNRALLAVAEAGNCPIVLFDEPRFAEHVGRAMRFHGYDLRAEGSFYDEDVVRSRTSDWREHIQDDQAITLYDKLAKCAHDSKACVA